MYGDQSYNITDIISAWVAAPLSICSAFSFPFANLAWAGPGRALPFTPDTCVPCTAAHYTFASAAAYHI